MKGGSFLPNQPYAIQYEENLIYKVNTIFFLSYLESNLLPYIIDSKKESQWMLNLKEKHK